MSDESAAAISAVRRDWVSEHREMYLRSGGAQGHIMDITAVGGRLIGEAARAAACRFWSSAMTCAVTASSSALVARSAR